MLAPIFWICTSYFWLLNFLPPAEHHFNVEAPMKVTAFGDQVTFIKVGAELSHVGFRSSDQKLKPGTDASASIFLCDDAKTFCTKKTVTFVLNVNSELKSLEFLPVAPHAEGEGSKPMKKPVKSVTPKPKKSGKKDELGFWNNNLSAALAESAKKQKPILIDFYGIWCPPCNQYNETIFPTKKFKKAAKNWVLLKMDADAAESFELKSHFKVGGYPTLLAVKAVDLKPADENTADENKADENKAVQSLVEVDRIVGFYPLDEFTGLMAKAYDQRKITSSARVALHKAGYLQALKDDLEIRIEKKEITEALPLAEEGAKIESDHSYFALTALTLKSDSKVEVLKDPASIELLQTIWKNRETEEPVTLLRMIDCLTTHSDQYSKPQIAWANDLLDSLDKRVDSITLNVPNVELSVADIDALRVEVAEALGDSNLLKLSYVRVVGSYQRLMKQFHQEDSRGLNLEYAYYLWKSGNTDQAKAIYSRFIAKYPQEFTFYYPASKMYLELKDYPNAQSNAEKAVELGYGDNKIRAEENLIRVLAASGQKPVAVARGKEFLARADVPAPEMKVRTGRYLHALQKAVDEAEKGKL
jgi:thiol-disulfide isomerase/thioredoxin